MDDVDIIIVGAGVVGLAIAAEVAKDKRDVYVIEKNSSFGQETSSRNSEVIHSGMYYPAGTLKSNTCLEGNNLLYSLCKKENIPHKKIGKLVVAKDDTEVGCIEKLFNHALGCGVKELSLVEEKEIKQLEPNIKASLAIKSGTTGIIDSHSLMSYLEKKARIGSAQFIYNTKVDSISRIKSGYSLEITDSDKQKITFNSKIVINSAGLFSDKIAQMVGINDDSYKLKYCKGQYFRISAKKSKLINGLIYPVPDVNGRDLGIHATPDLGGGFRLGPDAFYLKENTLDYSIDANRKRFFYESTKDFLPFIEKDDLTEDTAGIRPKLQGPNEHFRDFIIKHELERGLGGFINLVGIESPGLTASLSIANLVKKQIEEIF